MTGQLAPWEPQGRALRDEWRGASAGPIEVHVHGGDVERLDAAHFFREPADFDDWEHSALQAARGDVLDLGAGAGCHALALQARGLRVRAYDVDSHAVSVMRARGVQDVQLGSLAEAPDACCDSLLLLMHGIGLAGDVEGLAWLAEDAARVLRPGGRWIVDGRGPPDEADCGVSRQHLEYDGSVGAPYDWLWPHADFVQHELARAGWRCAALDTPRDGRWLLVAER
ncbi:MAG: methyltransferase [Planctomycetota bacterium]|nr:MAG: methyltransferase [Planctomycetota bacterium]